MEGPSLHLAASQLKPFKGQRILRVSGNATIPIKRLEKEVVRDVFAWGKHLVMQCGDFALRTHFLLFGSFEAEVNGASVTGDYKRPRIPRLALVFPNGELRLYTCSVRFIEGRNARRTYDFTIDIMSRAWDMGKAWDQLEAHREEEVADVLLDQDVFAGVGNIIKNEVLALVRLDPRTLIKALSVAERKELLAETRRFSKRFLAWRKVFLLKMNLRIHRKRTCPICGGPVTRMKTGKRQRMAHFCPVCQPLKKRK